MQDAAGPQVEAMARALDQDPEVGLSHATGHIEKERHMNLPPLATTSINQSGEPPAHDGVTARLVFPDLPLLAPLPWPTSSGQPSRVLVWKVNGWQRLR